VTSNVLLSAEAMNSQRIIADNVNSLADNAVLQTTIVRLQTQLDAANSELNALWDDEYVPRDVENEVRAKENLLKARKEVENLQAQKNTMEEDLYQSQAAKERLEQILKKQDAKYMEMKSIV